MNAAHHRSGRELEDDSFKAPRVLNYSIFLARPPEAASLFAYVDQSEAKCPPIARTTSASAVWQHMR